MLRKPLLTVALGAMLASCTMAPNYERPDFAAAPEWNSPSGFELPVGEAMATKLTWQEFFADQHLKMVIETALENNKNLRESALNIAEARAMYRINRADLLPTVNANGSYTATESSERSNLFGSGTRSTDLYEVNLGVASYELDFFGRLRSQSNAAINDYLATKEAYAVVRNALIAETANAYLQYLADKKLLDLTKKTLDAQKNTYELLQKSLDSGIGTEQDLSRAATAVETAQVNYHQYSRFVAQDENALFLLMGVPNDRSMLGDVTLDDIELRDDLMANIPSEVLLLRPDVRQAEYELKARNAEIGAARAAFFPSITLTGNYGFASTTFDGLFSDEAFGAWSFMPQIRLPIFEGGRNRANLEIANLRKRKEILQYEAAIQTAFREVSDELAARATLDQQLAAQRRLVKAAERVYEVAQARFKGGVDSFLSVLDSQRELYSFQQNEIGTQREQLSNLVTLYKVLGGGTEPAVYKKLDEDDIEEPLEEQKKYKKVKRKQEKKEAKRIKKQEAKLAKERAKQLEEETKAVQEIE